MLPIADFAFILPGSISLISYTFFLRFAKDIKVHMFFCSGSGLSFIMGKASPHIKTNAIVQLNQRFLVLLLVCIEKVKAALLLGLLLGKGAPDLLRIKFNDDSCPMLEVTATKVKFIGMSSAPSSNPPDQNEDQPKGLEVNHDFSLNPLLLKNTVNESLV